MIRSTFLAATALAHVFFLPPSLQAEPLKATCWNIEWFPGGYPNASKRDQTKQLKGASTVLQKLAPDILLAQEVTDERAFEKLATAVPEMKVHVFSQFLESDGKTVGPQQCAIASTLKANSAWFEAFAPTADLPNLRRGFAFAALEHPDGGLMMFYCVHLKSNRGSDTPEGAQDVADTRAESVRQIIAHKAEMEKKFADQKIIGWVIAGDFNTNHDGQFPVCTVVADFEKAGFHNTWGNTPKKDRATWRSDPDPNDRRFEPTTFDYFMTTGFKKADAVMVPDVPRELSDHNPIMLMLSPE